MAEKNPSVNSMATQDSAQVEAHGTDRVGDFIVNCILEGEESSDQSNIQVGMGMSTIFPS